MRKWMVAAAALALLVASSDTSAKGLFKKRGGSCDSAPACDQGQAYQYVTEYVTVSRTVCEVVPVTAEVDVIEYETKEIRTPKKEKQVWYENELKTRKEKQ